MDSFQDKINYENRIAPEDRDKLIFLLEEYSAKLRKRCDLIDRNYRNLYIISTSFVVSLGVIIVAFFLKNDPNLLSKILNTGSSIIFPLIIFFLYSTLGLYYLSVMSRRRNKIDSRNHEAHSLAYRLDKLVRIASEFYEHVEKKTISKIELDLKIAEAESVLNYYDSIIGKPKKYSDKERQN